MVTGMASFAISIQRVCKNVLLGSHWFSESLRYMCVSEMEPDRESECAAGKPGTDLTKSARSAPSLVFALFIIPNLQKTPNMGHIDAIPVPGILICLWTRQQREGREAQAVREAKQEQNFVIRTGLNLTEAGIPSAL